MDIEDRLEKLEEALLQADIGMLISILAMSYICETYHHQEVLLRMSLSKIFEHTQNKNSLQ